VIIYITHTQRIR